MCGKAKTEGYLFWIYNKLEEYIYIYVYNKQTTSNSYLQELLHNYYLSTSVIL